MPDVLLAVGDEPTTHEYAYGSEKAWATERAHSVSGMRKSLR